MNLEAKQRISDVQERVERVCAAEDCMTTCVRPAELALYLPTAETMTRRTTFAQTSMIVIVDVEISLDNDSVFAGVEISLPQRYVNGGAKVLTRKPLNSSK